MTRPSPIPHARRAAAGLVLALAASAALAWSNHTLGAYPALAALPALARAAPVAAEPLEAFVQAEGPALEKLLADEEAWARANVPAYPPRPEALAFRAAPAADGTALRQRLLAALRVNPQSRLPLYVQRPPGGPEDARPPLNWSKVTLLRAAGSQIAARFVALQPGEPVAPLEVVASGCDEPDYGLDVGLWSDSGQPFDAAYALGAQPFGGKAYEYASQAPLHMAFWHEAAIVERAAPFLRRTLPAARVHLYQALAAHALRSGHPYWGWRFAGWALHYVQDLTQPYHARVLPGVSTARMLWINALDLVGLHGAKNDAVTLVGNRHTVLENIQYQRLRDALARGDQAEPLLAALRGADAAAETSPPWTDATLRESVTQESAEAADAVDAALEAALPARYVSDPGFTVAGDVAVDPASLGGGTPATRAALDRAIAARLARFGVHSRAFVRDLLRRAGP